MSEIEKAKLYKEAHAILDRMQELLLNVRVKAEIKKAA